MNKIYSLFGIGSCFLCSGCASIISDTSYPVNISSSPEGAPFVVRNENGVAVARGRTPDVVTLEAGDGYFSGATYTIESGSERVTLDSNLDEWYWGNILFGGLIGMLIVDPATGAMWELPESVHFVSDYEDDFSDSGDSWEDEYRGTERRKRSRASKRADDFEDEAYEVPERKKRRRASEQSDDFWDE